MTFSDAARRIADAVNLHLVADKENNVGKWVACRLSDGVPDPTLYDTKEDAVRFQLHETQCVYVCILPTGMPYTEAETLLAFTRKLYDVGMRMPSPEREVVMPSALEDVYPL